MKFMHLLSGRSVTRFFPLFAIVLLAGCTTVKLASPPVAKSDAGVETDYPVAVFFDDNGCPLFTLYEDQPGGVPRMDGNDTISWTAQTVSGNPLPADFMFAVIFDPIRGGRPLIGNPDIASVQLERSEKLPLDVSFKYTIVKVTGNDGEIDRECPSLDPMIRII